MTTYNDKTEDNLSRQIRPVLYNTAKDGSGDFLFPVVDANGYTLIAAGTNLIGQVELAIGDWTNAIITIATDDDLTAAVDLGGDYDSMVVSIPTIDSSDLTLYVAETVDGTYKAFGSSITVAAGTGNFVDVWNIGGVQFIKIGTSAAQTSNRTFRVRGVRG